MSDRNFDLFKHRENNKKEIVASINRAFRNREHNLETAQTEMLDDQRKHVYEYNQKKSEIENSLISRSEKIAEIEDLTINLGKFKQRTSMAITYDSHDYPFLLEEAWKKIQNESGRPIHFLPPPLQAEVSSQISRMLREEYHHAVPIEGMEQVERCFGVIFFEEGGEYGITPFMGFGGELSILTYGDIFIAPHQTSKVDHDIIRLLE